MAEHFSGRNYTVYTTNGGGEELLQAWITLAERMDDDDDRNAVLAFLRTQMDWGDGGRSFNFNPPPTPIASPQRLKCLAKIVAAFAVELTREEPDPSLTLINWDRQLQMKWLANLLDIHELIGEAIADHSDSLDSLEPILSSLTLQDRIDCQLHRLATRKIGLKRQFKPGQILYLLDLIDQELALLAQDASARARLIADRYYERYELLADLGDLQEQIAALKLSVAAEPDPESKKLLEEMVEELEQEIRTPRT